MTKKKRYRESIQVTDTPLKPMEHEDEASPSQASDSAESSATPPEMKSSEPQPSDTQRRPRRVAASDPNEDTAPTPRKIAARGSTGTGNSKERTAEAESEPGKSAPQATSPVADDLRTARIDNRQFQKYEPPVSKEPPPPVERREKRRRSQPTESRRGLIGTETSAFPRAQKSQSPPSPDAGSVAGAEDADSSRASSGGDTIKMKSVSRTARPGVAPGPDQRPSPFYRRPLRPRPKQERVSDEPRIVVQRQGFFSFIFGFIGLIFRMVLATGLVMAIVGYGSYHAIKMYVHTDEVTVPDVRGIRVAEAFDRLSEKKLGMVKERSEASGLVAPGEVIDQEPPAGTKSKEGASVRVVVSSGRAAYMVPNVINESRDNAENRIKGARLEVGNITYIENDKIPRDVVINQTPDPNKGLDQPTKVDLLISSGPKGSSLTMPDVTGRKVSEAKAALARLGITDIVVDPPDAGDATVNAQDPLVGKLILQTQKVTLIVKK